MAEETVTKPTTASIIQFPRRARIKETDRTVFPRGSRRTRMNRVFSGLEIEVLSAIVGLSDEEVPGETRDQLHNVLRSSVAKYSREVSE
jgi:hypothetical protein